MSFLTRIISNIRIILQSIVLTMTGCFSKWVDALPIVNQSTETVAKNMISIWITHFGQSPRITSDQGRQFESQLFLSFRKYFDFQISKTAT